MGRMEFCGGGPRHGIPPKKTNRGDGFASAPAAGGSLGSDWGRGPTPTRGAGCPRHRLWPASDSPQATSASGPEGQRPGSCRCRTNSLREPPGGRVRSPPAAAPRRRRIPLEARPQPARTAARGVFVCVRVCGREAHAGRGCAAPEGECGGDRGAGLAGGASGRQGHSDRSGRSPSSDGCRANRLQGRGLVQQQVPSHGAGGQAAGVAAGPRLGSSAACRPLQGSSGQDPLPFSLLQQLPDVPVPRSAPGHVGLPTAHLTRGSAGGPEAGPARAPAGRKSQPRAAERVRSVYGACRVTVVAAGRQMRGPGPSTSGGGSHRAGLRARGPRGLCRRTDGNEAAAA